MNLAYGLHLINQQHYAYRSTLNACKIEVYDQRKLRTNGMVMVEEETVYGAMVVRRPDDMEAEAVDKRALRGPVLVLYPRLRVIARRPDDMEAEAEAVDKPALRSPLLYPGLPLAPVAFFPVAYLAHKPAMVHSRRTKRLGWPIW
jgi:hypothetical protein